MQPLSPDVLAILLPLGILCAALLLFGTGPLPRSQKRGKSRKVDSNHIGPGRTLGGLSNCCLGVVSNIYNFCLGGTDSRTTDYAGQG